VPERFSNEPFLQTDIRSNLTNLMVSQS